MSDAPSLPMLPSLDASAAPAQQQVKLEIKIDNAELAKRKLFIGTPMYGGQCGGLFARSVADLTALCTHYKVQLQLHFLFNESLITRARNYICDEFMRSGFDHLMFIDSDIGFDARDVVALMVLQSQNEAYDIIGGPYPKKTISWEKIVQAVNKGLADKNPNDLEKFVGDFVFNPAEGQSQIPLFQPVAVREVGTGFMCIRRSAFERFQTAYPHFMYRPDHVRTKFFDGSREIMQFFQAEIDGIDFAKEYRAVLDQILSGDISDKAAIVQKVDEIAALAAKRSKRYLSEDYWFNQRCHDIGVKTYLCPWMKLQHMGSYVFGGSLIDLAAAGAAATADQSLLVSTKK
jgi:hypothetical protein